MREPSSRCCPRSSSRCPACTPCGPEPSPSAPVAPPATTAASRPPPSPCSASSPSWASSAPASASPTGCSRRSGPARWGPSAPTRVTIVPPGAQGAFLADLPITLLEDPELTSLLPRLGIRTLGEFAALGVGDVVARFGPMGARLHALAAGRDPRPATPRIPPRDVDVQVDFEPPLDRVDQVAFGVRAAADDFIAALLAQRLVCTALRVEFFGENGDENERVWLHPRGRSPRQRWSTGCAGS